MGLLSSQMERKTGAYHASTVVLYTLSKPSDSRTENAEKAQMVPHHETAANRRDGFDLSC